MGAVPAPGRSAALALLGDVRRRNARARDLMRSSDRLRNLDARDVALADRLVLGVCATRGQLDAMIDSHVRRPGSLEPRVRDALRLSAFELCRLSTEPAVAVSQGVELVRLASPRAAGLANAVLRRVAEEDAPTVASAVAALRAGEADERLVATAAGWPGWLASEAAASIGLAAAAEAAVCALDPAPVWVSGNGALRGASETRDLLRERGVAFETGELPGTLRLSSAAALSASGLVAEGLVVASDLAARACARIASPEPGASVLEVGQGRGTKTLLLEDVACELGGPARIVGIDSIASKRPAALRRLAGGWRELCSSVTFDARRLADDDLPPELAAAFDLVFVDAPCSGTGTMRRHPEIPWSLTPSSVSPAPEGSLTGLQVDILRAAASRVAPGGVLAYSTCSLLANENDRVIDAFLASREGEGFAVADPLAAPGVSRLPEAAREVVARGVDARGFFRTHPTFGGPDGHFCARLVRR